jgi:hypothetical protein
MARNKEIIIKRNDLIEARFTNRTPTVIQNRLILYLASQIRHKEDSSFEEVEFGFREIREVIKHNCTLPELKKEIKGIMEIVGETYDPIDESWRLFHIIDRAKISEKTGMIKLRIGADMAPYFLRINESLKEGVGFTTLGYEQMAAMKSVYSQRMYELLMQYVKIGTRTIELDVLRKYLGLFSEYYNQWKRIIKLLNQAQEECALSGLVFAWQPVKKGKVVVSVKFDFTAYDGLEIDSRLLREGLSKVVAAKIQKMNTPSEIDAVFFDLEKQRDSIKDVRAWLTSRLVPAKAKARKEKTAIVAKLEAEQMDEPATQEDIKEMFSELFKI